MNKTVKTLLAAALLSIPVTLSAASAQEMSAPMAQLYIANMSDVPSPVDIYVDGQLFASNVFSGDTSMFAKDISVGTHTVVVTPNYAAPGVADILNTTITVPAGGSTLTLNNTTDTSGGVSNQTGFELDFGSAPQ